MSLLKSSFCNTVLVVLTWSLAVQETVAQSVLCHQYQTFEIENNAWGADGTGSQCTTVENDYEGTSFSTTWVWTATDATYAQQTKVHSNPNIKSNSNTFPLMLQNITALTASANWSMYPSGTGAQNTFDVNGLRAAGTKADVTFDFCLDPDAKKSTDTISPAYEVMIWFATLAGIEPIGYYNGSSGNIVLEGQNYTLYQGMNNQTGQMVYSFVAPENRTAITNLDVLPFFQYLVDKAQMPNTTYLGTAQFGTETFHTVGGKKVTFAASGVNFDVQTRGLPPAPEVPDSPEKRSEAISSHIGVMGGRYCVYAIWALFLWPWVL